MKIFNKYLTPILNKNITILFSATKLKLEHFTFMEPYKIIVSNCLLIENVLKNKLYYKNFVF